MTSRVDHDERFHEDASPHIRAAMSILAGRDLLRRVVDTFAPAPVVALKGVVVSALDADGPRTPRRMLDLDILIPSSARSDLEGRIRRMGLRQIARTHGATTFRDEALGIDLDLHVRLCEPGLFRLDEQAILKRAASGASLGLPSLVPERHDLYAHLIAHFVRNRSSSDDLRRLRDLRVVGNRLPMEPANLAARLAADGLARASRLVLPWVGNEFAAATLQELPNDPLGQALSGLARQWLGVAKLNGSRAFPVPHLLNHSLLAGFVSATSHAVTSAARRAGAAALVAQRECDRLGGHRRSKHGG